MVRGMKKYLQGPMDFVWCCDHGAMISGTAHIAKQHNLYCNDLAKLLANMSR